MAAGVCIEKQSTTPEQVAKLLLAYAERGKKSQCQAAMQLANLSKIDKVVPILLQGGDGNAKLLAGRSLAIHAWLMNQGVFGGSKSGSASGGGTGAAKTQGKGKGKAGQNKNKAGNKGKSGKSTGGHGKAMSREQLSKFVKQLLTSGDATLIELGQLTAAWAKLADLKKDLLAAPKNTAALAGSRCLYLAHIGETLDIAMLRYVYGEASKNKDGQFCTVSPNLHTYEILSTPMAYLAEAIGVTKSKDYLQVLHLLASNPDIRVAIAALKAIENIGATESLPTLQALVASPKTPWCSLVFAASAIGAIPDKSSIEVLLARLAKEQGRVRIDLIYALSSIVGKTSYNNARDWNAWWERSKATFQVDPAKTATYRKTTGIHEIQADPLGTFYDLNIYSDRLVFCLDTSLSMKGARLTSLKENLDQTLKSLKPEVQFNITDFGGTLRIMSPYKLTTLANRERARTYVKYLNMTLGTRTYGGMELSCTVPEMDTILLLSDGAPVAGKFDAWKRINTAFLVYNRYRPVAVYSVEFGGSTANFKAMQELSNLNYGIAVSNEP